MAKQKYQTPESVLKALKTVHDSAITNMFDRKSVELAMYRNGDFEAVEWLEGQDDPEYMTALNDMGEYAAEDDTDGR